MFSLNNNIIRLLEDCVDCCLKMTCLWLATFALVISINSLTVSTADVLEIVNDDDLEKLIVNEKYVIALFIPSRELKNHTGFFC